MLRLQYMHHMATFYFVIVASFTSHFIDDAGIQCECFNYAVAIRVRTLQSKLTKGAPRDIAEPNAVRPCDP